MGHCRTLPICAKTSKRAVLCINLQPKQIQAGLYCWGNACMQVVMLNDSGMHSLCKPAAARRRDVAGCGDGNHQAALHTGMHETHGIVAICGLYCIVTPWSSGSRQRDQLKIRMRKLAAHQINRVGNTPQCIDLRRKLSLWSSACRPEAAARPVLIV